MQNKIYTIVLSAICCINNVMGQKTHPVNGVANPIRNEVVYINANIVVNAQTTLKNARLYVADNKIQGIGNIAISPSAAVIDLKGKYIYPSFIDLYSVYGVQKPNFNKNKEQMQQFISTKKGAYAWNEAIRAELNAADYFNYNKEQSTLLLEAGFGFTLSQINDGICRGSAALTSTGNIAPQQALVEPKAAAAFSFNKGSSVQDYPGSAMGAVALIRQTYLDADWYSKQQNSSIVPEERNLTLESFNQLKKLPIVFEAENKLAVLRAQRIAEEFGSNFIIKGNGDEYQRANEIKQSNAKLIIPLNFPKPYEVEDPFDAEYVSTADLKHWELAPLNPYLLHQQGVEFAFTMYGCSNANDFFKNLRLAVANGLPKDIALQALTSTPAKFLGINKRIGTLEKLAPANFFIASDDIFNDNAYIISHITMGVENVLKKQTDYLLNGKYISNNAIILNIKGSYPKYKLQFITASDTERVDLNASYGVYTCSFLDKNKKLIHLSFWPTKVADTASNQVLSLTGKIDSGNNITIPLNANWVEPTIDEKTDSKQKTDTITARVYFPFTDYGQTALPKPEVILFKNATVWTNEANGILTQTDVAIANGKISAIGKNLSVKNAKIIDATNLHLTSGIIDEHSHIAIYGGVNECTQAVTAEVRIGDVINCDDINIYRQLAGGVVAVQQLHGSCNPIGGQSSIIKLRWGLAPEQMKIANAPGYIKFALGENVKQSNWGNETIRYPQTRMGVEQVMIDAFYRAKAYENQRKKNPKLTRTDLELEAIVEILNGKRFISCHSYVQSEINMLMHVADSFKFTVNTFTHILEGYKVADKMKKHGAGASTFADWWAYKYEVVDAIPQNGVLLQKMGITTAINSDDAEMGRRLNQEAAKMLKYGNITEEEAWKMVTLNPAKLLRIDHLTGSIKPGKDADLVLWSTNPLSIYAKPLYTLVDGIIYYSAEKDEQLRKEIKAERRRIITKMIEAKRKGEKTEHKVSEPDPNYHCEDEDW
jgi:imidazolonepropionase-like amidohydrolase